MDQTAWWWSLVTLVLGALIALGAGLVKDVLNRRWSKQDADERHARDERNHWRDERLSLYNEVIASMWALHEVTCRARMLIRFRADAEEQRRALVTLCEQFLQSQGHRLRLLVGDEAIAEAARDAFSAGIQVSGLMYDASKEDADRASIVQRMLEQAERISENAHKFTRLAKKELGLVETPDGHGGPVRKSQDPRHE